MQTKLWIAVMALGLGSTAQAQRAVIPGVSFNGLNVEVVVPRDEQTSFRGSWSGISGDGSVDSDALSANASIKLSHLGGFVDYYPTPGSGFFLTGGLVLNNNSLEFVGRTLAGNATTTGNTTIATVPGDSSLTVSLTGDTNTGTTTLDFDGGSYIIEPDEVYGSDGKFYLVHAGTLYEYSTRAAAEDAVTTDGSPPDAELDPDTGDPKRDTAANFLNGITEDVRIRTDITWDSNVAPYVGMGYRNYFAERWVFNVQGGILLASGLDADVSANCVGDSASCNIASAEINTEVAQLRADIDETLSDLPSFWPVLSIGVGFTF